MTLSPIIDVGQIAEIIGFLVTIIGALFVMREGVASLSTRMEKVEEELGKQTDILIRMAEQTIQIVELQRRVSVLERDA